MRVFETLQEMETDFYRWSATKIIRSIDYKEFNLVLKGEPYSFTLYVNLKRLEGEFLELEQYEYLCGIRDYIARYE